VDGILATSLSVNTSHMSSYYSSLNHAVVYLLDHLALLNEPFFDCCLLCSLTEVREINADDLPEQSHHDLSDYQSQLTYHLMHEAIGLLILCVDHSCSSCARNGWIGAACLAAKEHSSPKHHHCYISNY
jgi:hypothetical protein